MTYYKSKNYMKLCLIIKGNHENDVSLSKDYPQIDKLCF